MTSTADDLEKDSPLSEQHTPQPDAVTTAPQVTEADDEIEAWVRTVGTSADDKLGRETLAFFVGDVLGITDWFVVTSGSNARQTRAIAEQVEETLSESGGPKPLRVEGLDTGEWVLMDYGAFVVHIFTDEARRFYELERLWDDVPRLNFATER